MLKPCSPVDNPAADDDDEAAGETGLEAHPAGMVVEPDKARVARTVKNNEFIRDNWGSLNIELLLT